MRFASSLRFASALICTLAAAGGEDGRQNGPPNIVLIMADDLGYSDLGCYGGEIATPNLDKVAARGVLFTQFYNTARCWPSRASLLTGYYPQQVRRDKVPGLKGTGGGGKRPAWAPLLPKRLATAGYRSYHVGKWHVDGMPVAEGFDRSYYLKDQSRFFSPKIHWKDDAKLPPVERGSGFYGTVAVADHALEFLREHATEHRVRPFFLYMAFAAPHFPLHALPEDIARYQGRYDCGWAEVRAERWRRLRGEGLLEGQLSAVEKDVGPPYDFPDHLQILGAAEVNRPLPWGELTPAQRSFQADKMEVHAAMIDRMDREIGRVLREIEEAGQLDDTLVVFLSDNGASAEIMVRGDGHDPEATPGSASTYLCLGPGWSTVANTPFRRHKTWVHEGGISTPLIMSWPKGLGAAGETRGTAAHLIDLHATLLDLAGVRSPSAGSEAPPPPGCSLRETLVRDAPLDRGWLWWCHEGNRAVRVGDWKLVAAKGEPWELYDLATDRSEGDDVSAAHPEKVREMAALWQRRMDEFAAAAKPR